MLCPRCKQVLRVRQIGGVEVDQCLECGGTWFDRDELRQAKDAVEPDLNWMDFEIWQDQDCFACEAGTLDCPKCLVPMAAIRYGDTEIQIDHCLRCEGVWLDDGEFAKILEAMEAELLTKSAPDYVRASLAEAREIVGGPEGVASEWRDFLTVIRLLQYRVLEQNPRLHDALTMLHRGSASL